MRRLTTILILAFLVSACAQAAQTEATRPASPTASLAASAVASPVRPATPTPTTTPASTQVWEPWPGPIHVTGYEPGPAETVWIDGGNEAVPPHAYILMGADWQEGRESYNADTMILAIANPGGGFVSLISIPRDLLVFVPGVGMLRINSVFALLGPEALTDTIVYNFGVEPLAFVAIDMQGFRNVINALGGIEVTPAVALDERCYGQEFNLRQGVAYHLDGRRALCYARNRGTSNDFSRMPRQQEVLLAILDRFGSVNADNFLTVGRAMFDTYRTYVTTDADFTREGFLAVRLLRDWQGFRTYVIGSDLVTPLDDPELGNSLLLPIDPVAIHILIQTAAEGVAWP